MKVKFEAAQFTATKWDSAEAKANALTDLVSFVDAGFPKGQFTGRVYDALYLHMLGHIAHYDRAGFFAEWFATLGRQLRWLEYVARGGAYGGGHGDPAFTWSDAETALIDWVRSSGILARQQAIVRERTRARELEQLAVLRAKYGDRAAHQAA